jgi:O-antigen ligase
VELIDPQGLQILKNPTFVQGPRYWGHIAHANFLPWHMDNLYLELLIERGLLGLAVLAALAVGALVMLAQGVAHQKPLALIVGISIAATLLIGVVISVIEIPRVSTMLWLLLVVSPLVRED